MESAPAKQWWNENRDELKLLTTWTLFAQRVKDRFVPPNWRMDALAKFYSVSQGSSPFADFVSNLQDARDVLASGGTGFTVNDSIIKNHLPFFCHPILSLRIRSIPNFKCANTKLDALICLMTSVWDAMIAERLVRPALSSKSPTTPSMSCPFLSESEREALKLASGCFRFWKTSASRGWVPHSSRNCPGYPVNNIPPAAGASTTVELGALMTHGNDQAEERQVPAVLPSVSSFVLQGDEYDEDLDASDHDSD